MFGPPFHGLFDLLEVANVDNKRKSLPADFLNFGGGGVNRTFEPDGEKGGICGLFGGIWGNLGE